MGMLALAKDGNQDDFSHTYEYYGILALMNDRITSFGSYILSE